MTFISFSKNLYFTLSNDYVDIHGQYELMNFSIQCKFKNPKYKIPVSEIRDNALRELNNSPVMNKICVCFYYQIIDKIKEHVNLLKNKKKNMKKDAEERKRKSIELEYENNIFRKTNKKIKNERNKKYEKLLEKLRKENNELKEKINTIENQNKEINEKLDLILNKLN
ncbi:8019_t:CDS:2 [Cetraspora pellucida]|uniref:8019_t:CDS:1 n=1 Tax=Cetraspora pellucida TaxID=1433469 RepID=A0ACA9LS04_9GLOM|nr:8019_t:CDS:2 [Cetraspora pellucida]